MYTKDGFHKALEQKLGDDAYLLLANGGHKKLTDLLTAASLTADGNNTKLSITVGGTTKTSSVTVPYASAAAKWSTARTLTIGSTGKSVNGSANVSWSLAEIGAAAAGHAHRYINSSGFSDNGSTSLSTWGTLITANGYTGILNINDPSGGSWEIAYKSGQQFHQIDGYYYQNEGRYRVTDVTETVTALGTSGNYLTWTKNGNTSNITVPYASSAGSVAWGNVTSKPATATRWPTWAEVTSKPGSTGSGTQPVYWNGSTFVACTAYGSASVNYANSAGVATGITNGFKRFEFNAGKTYIGWVSIAKLQLNTSNQYDYNSFNLYICRSYNSPSSESYAINITIGWVKATVRLIGKSIGSQIINKCRIAIDTTNHVLYLQVYVNTAYTTYANSCSATLVGIVNNNWTSDNTVNNSLTNVTELDLTTGIQSDYATSAGSVAWGNVTSKPATATRWPTWDEVTGKPLSATSGNNGPTWGNFVPVKSDGVMEIGKYLDFHNSSNDGVDYAVRLQCQGNNKVVINLPTGAGTLARTADLTWGNVTGKPSTFAPSTHTHGLTNSVFFVSMPSQNSNKTWKNSFGYNMNSNLLMSVRINSPAPEWCVGDYGSGILYGGADTKGFMSSSYGTPKVMWAGGNGTGDDAVPKWYFGITGTSGTIYNLNSMPYASSAGSVAWGNVTGKPSTFTPSSHTHSYLPLSGGTMTGTINCVSNYYVADSRCGINMNNSDIIGCNSIRFGDLSDDYTESLMFYRSNGNWDSFRAKDGTFYFGVNNGTEYTAIHSGNIGSQSVNYASSAGNADTVDSYHASSLFRDMGGGNWNFNFSDGFSSGAYYVHGNWSQSNAPATYGLLLDASTSAGHLQIASSYEKVYYIRGCWWTGGGGTWDSWRTIIHSGNISSQSVSYASSAGSATVASKIWDPDYHDYSHRRTSANINYADGALHYYLATSTMTTGKPSSDAHILHMAWDNGSWEGQLALPTSGSMQWRTMNGGTWTGWYTILDSSNYTSYCATSGHNHNSSYVLKSGDTMTGNLNMGNHVLSGCDSVRLNDTCDDWTEGFMIPRSNGNWDSLYAVDGTFYLSVNSGTLKDSASLGSSSANLYCVYTNRLHPGSGNNLWMTSDNNIYLSPGGASTSGNNCVIVGSGYMHIRYSTNSTMTYGTTNPRLIFSENGTQAVGLVYCDWDAYRHSKGIKCMDVDNNDPGNVWFEVQGSCYAPSFYTTSDRTKKTNIEILSEHIRKFTFKETNKDAYGVIAQEVPEMFRDGEEGNMTVNYNSVLSYYIGLLENKVKNLEETNKKLLEFIEKTYGKTI